MRIFPILVGIIIVDEYLKRRGKGNNRKPLKDCPRPRNLSELDIPGLQRHTRSYPVYAQEVSFYRNLIEDPYNYPNNS